MARARHALRRAPALTRAQRAAVRDASKSATITITSTPRKSSGATPRKTKSPSPGRLERQKIMSKALADHAADVVNGRYGKNGKRRFSSSPQKASPIKITIKTRTPAPKKMASPQKRSSSRASSRSPMTPGRLFKRTQINKALAKEAASKVVKQRQVVAKEAQKLIRDQTKLANAAKSLVKSPRRRGPQTPGGTHLLRGPSAGKKRGDRYSPALKIITDFSRRYPGKVPTIHVTSAPSNTKTFVIPVYRANNDLGKAFIVQGGRPSAVLNKSLTRLRNSLPDKIILARAFTSKADGKRSTKVTTVKVGGVRDGVIQPSEVMHKNTMSPHVISFLMREHS